MYRHTESVEENEIDFTLSCLDFRVSEEDIESTTIEDLSPARISLVNRIDPHTGFEYESKSISTIHTSEDPSCLLL